MAGSVMFREKPFVRAFMTTTPPCTLGDAPPLYVFVHLPKAAGQSIRSHLRAIVDDPEAIAVVNMGGAEEKLRASPDFTRKLHNLKLVMGHRATRKVADLFAPRKVRFATILRDPTSYMVSRFNYETEDESLEPNSSKAIDAFIDYIAKNKNQQSRWFMNVFLDKDPRYTNRLDETTCFNETSALLDEFWCIGSVENIKDSMKPLFDAVADRNRPFMKRINMAGRDYKKLIDVTDDLRPKVEQYTQVDLAIYERYIRST